MKIILFIPYYGNWPNYFNLFLKSYENNHKSLDICFITDIAPPTNYPSNVRFVNYTFNDLLDLIIKKTEINVPQIIPYKLCDFRPAYGLIFDELIKGYNFWGYCDIDLIYGDQSLFLTKEVLENNDIISFKKGHLQGPFTIYRNTEHINNLFKTGGHYKKVFSNPDYCSFDEFGPDCFYVNIRSKSEVIPLPDDNISVIAFKEEIKGNLRIYNEQNIREDLSKSEVLVYDNGRLYDNKTGKDYFFFHWVLDKRNIWFRYPKWVNSPPDKYYITCSGFYSSVSICKLNFLTRKSICFGMAGWWFLKITNYIKRRIGLEVILDTYPRKGWVKSLK